MRIKNALLMAAASLIVSATPASAHDQWFYPHGTIFSGDNAWVTIDAGVSNVIFHPDHVAMQLGNVKAWRPDGTEAQIQNGATGRRRSMFDVELNQHGTWRVGTAQTSVSGTFKVDGAEWRLGGRRGPAQQANRVDTVDQIPANATDIALTESSSRNEVFITADEPSEIKPLNKGLEMVPITHPAELVYGEPAQLRFLIDGQPAAGLKLEFVPAGKRYRNEDGVFEATTDAQGIATINWPMAGMVWMNTSFTDQKPSNARASQRRMSYITSLEVMAP